MERRENLDANLLSEVSYKEDESKEFDAEMRSGECLSVRQRNVSLETKTEMLYSSWCVPCHTILIHTPEGTYQLFHVQPDSSGPTNLSFDQEKALKRLKTRGAEAFVAKGNRSWFAVSDERELERCGVSLTRTTHVDTDNWWRLLYNPASNEIWIDIRDKKLLRKYKGF